MTPLHPRGLTQQRRGLLNSLAGLSALGLIPRHTGSLYGAQVEAPTKRGMNPYYHGRGIFRYDPTKHAESKPGGGSDFTVGARYAVGSMLKEATIGEFGGLAVFNRALSDAEMKQLHDAANLKALNK